jgi:hypothetical protein
LVDESVVERLVALLPEAVALAVECPEEPYDGRLRPGDVVLRFRRSGPDDVGGLDVTIEVRSKWFASRAENRQQRVDQLCSTVSGALGGLSVGVYLSLPVAAWSQTD